jgi:hypothetical protein
MPTLLTHRLLCRFSFLTLRHLRRILRAYADYYNRVRTHLALDKDAPSIASCRRLDQLRLSLSSPAFITNTPG